MRACLASVLLFLLGACAAFASPFDQVPKGDSAYADSALLAEQGIIDARPAGDFTGATLLTRYDFTVSLVRPMTALEALARGGSASPALDASAAMTGADRVRIGEALARLLEEFGDVLSLLGKDPSEAVLGARLFASPKYASTAAAPNPTNSAGVSYTSTRARLGVVYGSAAGEAAALPYIPLGGLADTRILGLASARLPEGRARGEVPLTDSVAATDISLRWLQGTFEYGVTANMTINLAYEAMVRQGLGASLLDAASLRTLAVGYRLSPSTSVKLSYHLIDYADLTGAGARLADRMAEGELTVRF